MSTPENKTLEGNVIAPPPMQAYPPAYYAVEEDTIDLLELWRTLMKYKWMIASLCVLALVCTRVWISFVPKNQESSIIYAPGFSTLSAGQFSTIASTLSNSNFLNYVIHSTGLRSYLFRTVYRPETKDYDFEGLLGNSDVTQAELELSKMLDAVTLKTGNNPKKGSEIKVTTKDPVVATALANVIPVLLENYVEQGLKANLNHTLQQNTQLSVITQKDMKAAYARLSEFRKKAPLTQEKKQGNFLQETIAGLKRERLALERKRGVLKQTGQQKKDSIHLLDLQISELSKQVKTLSEEIRTNESNQSKLQILVAETTLYQEEYALATSELKKSEMQANMLDNDLQTPESFIRTVESAKMASAVFNSRLIMALSLVLSLFLGIILAFSIEFFSKINLKPE